VWKGRLKEKIGRDGYEDKFLEWWIFLSGGEDGR
jgi:hypothetical protein